MSEPRSRRGAGNRDRGADALEALAQAANGEEGQPAGEPTPPPEVMDDVSDAIGDSAGAGPPPTTPAVRQRRAAQIRATRSQGDQLKKTLIPPMLVMGVILFLIGGWAVATLCGVNLLTDRPSQAADRLARIMLLCWPVGILMFVGVWLFQRDLKRDAGRKN